MSLYVFLLPVDRGSRVSSACSAAALPKCSLPRCTGTCLAYNKNTCTRVFSERLDKMARASSSRIVARSYCGQTVVRTGEPSARAAPTSPLLRFTLQLAALESRRRVVRRERTGARSPPASTCRSDLIE